MKPCGQWVWVQWVIMTGIGVLIGVLAGLVAVFARH
jgi:hypothetical protein